MADRDPLAGRLVVLVGGSGFIGRHVAEQLLERGARLRLASRQPEKAYELKPLANLGQLQFVRCDVRKRQSVEGALQGADAVVNLVGSFEGDLRALMGSAAGTVAEVAARVGAQALVHVSAIAADPAGETEYATAKKLGEELVRDAFPKATILRPSILFGEDDNFIQMFAGLIQTLPILPVFGPDARLQLVHVDDVAQAVATVLADPEKHGGKIYELGGPEAPTMLEVNRRIAAAQQRKRIFLPMPDLASNTFSMLPGSPMGHDQWLLLKQGNMVSGEFPGFKELDIEPRPLDLFLDRWMVRYRKQGRFSRRMARPTA